MGAISKLLWLAVSFIVAVCSQDTCIRWMRKGGLELVMCKFHITPVFTERKKFLMDYERKCIIYPPLIPTGISVLSAVLTIERGLSPLFVYVCALLARTWPHLGFLPYFNNRPNAVTQSSPQNWARDKRRMSKMGNF